MSKRFRNGANPNLALVGRRRALGALCALGAAGVVARMPAGAVASANAATTDCALSPQLTEGPFWVDEHLNRYDVTGGSTLAAIATAVPLYLQIAIVDAACQPLSGVQVDIGHCHAAGLYSNENAAWNDASTLGQTWLRGYRSTAADGIAQFRTIHPGWYPGRTTHIHVRALRRRQRDLRLDDAIVLRR
jgi:protocatechuate 3,4-dioxygenase beta subunit